MKWILSLIMFFCVLAVQAQENDSIMEAEVSDEEEYSVTTDSIAEAEEVQHVLVAPEDLTNEYKNEQLEHRTFDSAQWKKVVGSTNYHEEPKEKSKPKNRLKLNKSIPWGGDLLRVIFYVLVIALVLLLLYNISKNISFQAKLKRTAVPTDDGTAPVENIEEVNIQALLDRAISEGNLRLAVRLYYLGLLKKLNEKGIIIWKKDKTNRDYLNEIFTRNFHFDDMQRLTLVYEQIWYGEHSLSNETFQQLASNFQTVQQKLNTTESSE